MCDAAITLRVYTLFFVLYVVIIIITADNGYIALFFDLRKLSALFKNILDILSF